MNAGWIIGLSSGSSLDGVDSALVEVQGAGLELRLRLAHFVHQDYPRELRDLLVRATSSHGIALKQTSLLHRLLGECFAAVARQVADEARFPLTKVPCIGCPGQTIWHETERRHSSTLGRGMAALVAERTGLTTVSDLRTRDLAAGGLGFPLSPLVDLLIFHQAGEHRLLIHLGGLATIVSLPPTGQIRDLIGFQA